MTEDRSTKMKRYWQENREVMMNGLAKHNIPERTSKAVGTWLGRFNSESEFHDEVIERAKRNFTGLVPPNAVAVVIHGVQFTSILSAHRATGISYRRLSKIAHEQASSVEPSP